MIATLRRWLKNLRDVLDKQFKDISFPTVEPHELIRWITAGRFAANIACKEKIPFDTNHVSSCGRKFCRFHFHKNKLPSIIWRMIPRSRRKLSLVYINEYIDTMNRGSGSNPGELIDWNVHGIKFCIEWTHWAAIVESRGSEMVQLAAEIAHFWGTKRILIEVRRADRLYNLATIYGEFHIDHRFYPNKIQPSARGLVPIPICSAWQDQDKGQKQRKYTPVRPLVD